MVRVTLPFEWVVTAPWNGLTAVFTNLSNRKPLEIGTLAFVLIVGMFIGCAAATICLMRNPRIAKVYQTRVRELLAQEKVQKEWKEAEDKKKEAAKKKKAT
mmetsp:Transcript_22758/g.54430  ORF Transcript_22758/g.54430 Transcript_22758/m.54430 type:complete len:101 (-) Transcript_22758:182-484(-)|eukprot:CAMPEP_0180131266 /NCGR_PEP_ID=MMETSP0986-20121125/8324_1 /TAXON_ID=697907 /ORGANISM="non described non described, Strain CCMP2293" /LENGTH=100 /DNA_ID=CAMNT_0022071123 /DNA_START=88 /DNA_END=390 /DNA_ORIENTATION=+